MLNLQINHSTYKKPMSEAARKFFASPSKLSRNKRFQGSIKSNNFMQACTNQSSTNDKCVVLIEIQNMA